MTLPYIPPADLAWAMSDPEAAGDPVPQTWIEALTGGESLAFVAAPFAVILVTVFGSVLI